jgi:hypothetical protein
MARPRRSETGEVATKVIPVRLTASEHREIQTKKGDLSQSEYIRRAALDEDIPQQAPTPPVPAVNRQTYIELGHIGNNLNQQTQACHQALQQGQALDVDPQQLEALSTLVKQVRSEVMGLEPPEATDDDRPIDPA